MEPPQTLEEAQNLYAGRSVRKLFLNDNTGVEEWFQGTITSVWEDEGALGFTVK